MQRKKRVTKTVKKAKRKSYEKKSEEKNNSSVELASKEEEIKKAMQQALLREEKKGSSKIKTGVKKLDYYLGGGYPFPSVILVNGKPGVGKTPLAIAFASSNIEKGNEVIYVCLNNFPSEIKSIAKKIGYSLEKAFFIDAYSWIIGKEEGEHSISALNPTKILEILEEQLKKDEVKNVVLDSLSTMYLYHEEKTIQRFVQSFVAMVKENNACGIIINEFGTCSEEMNTMLEYLTDGTIFLEKGRLIIEKMAGTSVKKKEMRFDITKNGVEVD